MLVARPLRLAALSLLVASPLLAGGPARVRVEVADDRGEKLDLEISSSWLAPLLASLDVECEATRDRDARRMAERLDRAGEGSSYRFRDEDGDRVLATRRAGRLRLESTDEDGQRSTVELPWSVAECFLLGREPRGGFGELLRDDGLRIRVEDRDGESRVDVRID